MKTIVIGLPFEAFFSEELIKTAFKQEHHFIPFKRLSVVAKLSVIPRTHCVRDDDDN